MRIERKETKFIEITLKEAIRIPHTDVILEKGEKVLVPYSDKIKESKLFNENVVRFLVNIRDADKAMALVNDSRLSNVARERHNVYIVNGVEAENSLADLFDSYNIDYEIDYGR